MSNHHFLIVTILQVLWSKNITAVLEQNFAEYFERFTRRRGYHHITPIFLSYQYTLKLTILGILR